MFERLENIRDKFREIPVWARVPLALMFAVIFLLYYPIGMIATNHIDDGLTLDNSAFMLEGGSQSVATAEALIDREVNKHYWVANDPFFYPTWPLVRMPAFQRGIMSGIARFAIELNDQIGRTRGSSQSDPDLQKAVGQLNYSPFVWMWDPATSLLPTASTEAQYRAGLEALKRYHERVSKGQAPFERRADNLLDTLDRFASDLGSSSAAIDDHIHQRSSFAFSGAAELYYFTKGRMYAHYMIMKGLEVDFAAVLREKQLETTWKQAMESLRVGAELSNFFIFNAAPDNQFLPNHLAAQGFYLMRSRTQLREITNILLK